jgi:hypothetical protein
MKTNASFDPETYLRLIQLLLMGLEDLLASDQVNEGTRSAVLGRKLQSYKDKVAKTKSVLVKHREAEKRKRELEQDNRRRNPEN